MTTIPSPKLTVIVSQVFVADQLVSTWFGGFDPSVGTVVVNTGRVVDVEMGVVDVVDPSGMVVVVPSNMVVVDDPVPFEVVVMMGTDVVTSG